MYLAIDIGGTKTLLVVFSQTGELKREHKIATPKDYQQLLVDIASALNDELKGYQFMAVCCGLPGINIDRQNGIVPSFGNLPWSNVHIRDDLAKLLDNVPVYIENDAKLAGLYEALQYKAEYEKVLYLTLGTGIGIAYVKGGQIDLSWDDAGGHNIYVDSGGKSESWENSASGKALVEKYGKSASEIKDDVVWKSFANSVALGLFGLIQKAHPDVVIIGGGVGAHLEKFSDYLVSDLKSYQPNLGVIPPIIKANKAEEAVIYGCFDYIRQKTE